MIERAIELVRARAATGDALWRRAERTSVTFESGRLKSCAATEETGVNLRVLVDGRMGVAGTTADDADDLVARAVASAALGELVPITFPGTAPLPDISTFSSPAADAPLERLTAIGTELVSRVSREGCQVSVTIEREVAQTRVVNTAGTDAGYRTSTVVVGIDLSRFAGDDVLFVSDQYAGAGLPVAADLDALVRSIDDRYTPAVRVVTPPEGSLTVVFTPSGLSAILLPLEQALSGKTVLQGISPLGAKTGERVFDERFSLYDDPLVPGHPASRPCDDEGTPSRRLPLIERGVVRGFVYDLETAARAQAASTGHGARGTFGKPHIAYSSLIVGKREAGRGTGGFGGGLLHGITDGLLIDDLIGVGQGNVIGGAFSHPVALAYRVERGAITGRVKEAAVAGNVYDLLGRIGDFGTDGRWLGNRWTASLLLEGVSVARR